MDKLNFGSVVNLLPNTSFQNILVLFDFLLEFLGQLNHANFISHMTVILAFAVPQSQQSLIFLVFHLELAVLFEGLVAHSRHYLKHKVSEVPIANHIFRANLYEQAWLRKSRRDTKKIDN